VAETTPQISFDLPPAAYADLRQFAELAPQLAPVLVAQRPANFERRMSSLVTHVAKHLKMPEEKVHSAIRAILGIRGILKSSSLTAEALFEAMERHFNERSEAEWTPDSRKNWASHREPILQILRQTDDAFGFIVKRRELTYAHERIYRSSRLLVDIRPIYNKAADDIDDLVVTTSLVITYTNGADNSRQTVQFALDRRDVLDLLVQCERAKKKMNTLEEKCAKAQLPIFIADTEAS
jgi:hypothetical protein